MLDRRFEGWEGIAHGGIVCTILDEVMAWALVDHDLWGVTARMTVEFKRPVPIGRRIRAEGRVVGVRRRVIDAEGVLIEPDGGEVLARAEATYVGAPEARKEELKARYAFRLEPRGRSPGWWTPDDRAPWRSSRTSVSPSTQRARVLVSDRTPAAVAFGRKAGDLVHEPAAVATAVHAGFERLADPDYHEGTDSGRPGLGSSSASASRRRRRQPRPSRGDAPR